MRKSSSSKETTDKGLEIAGSNEKRKRKRKSGIFLKVMEGDNRDNIGINGLVIKRDSPKHYYFNSPSTT